MLWVLRLMERVEEERLMKTQSNTLLRVLAGATGVIIPLVAAAWLTPPDFPLLLRIPGFCPAGLVA
jgi:hypothetical protein